MEALRETPEDRAMRYCPPYAAPRKTGRPQIDKRIKSPLEVNKKRKKNERVDDLPVPKKGKHVGKRGGKGGGWKKEESRLMRSSYFLDYVIRNEVFCVGEVIVEVFLK
jgi:hypothetical protein